MGGNSFSISQTPAISFKVGINTEENNLSS